MVEVGTMEINGSINTSDIDSGIVRIEGALKVVETQAKQTQSSFDKLGTSTVAIGSALGIIATKGISALSGLVSKSPMLGSSFAKIDVELLKVSNTLGSQLKPIFDEIGNDLIPTLNTAFADLEPVITVLVDSAIKSFNLLSSTIDPIVKSIIQVKQLFSGEDPTTTEGGIIPSKSETAGYSKYGAYEQTAYEFSEKYMSYSDKYPQGGKPTMTDQLKGLWDFGALLTNIVIDTYQHFSGKETSFATSNGTSLGD